MIAVDDLGLVGSQLGQVVALADEVDDVHPEAVDASVEPEPQGVEHRGPHVGVVPVEVGLLRREQVQEPRLGRLVPRPRRLAGREGAVPVVGSFLGRAVSPHVPTALRVVPRRARCEEPRVLVARVVRHPVEQHLEAALVRSLDELVHVGQRSEHRIDVAVVADVVAVVDHRRAEHRRQPEGVDAEPLEVVEPVDDAAQVADAVAGRVAEAPWVDLVDDRGLPPRLRHPRSSRLRVDGAGDPVGGDRRLLLTLDLDGEASG